MDEADMATPEWYRGTQNAAFQSDEICSAAPESGKDTVPYWLRHSGPSIDISKKSRTLDSVMKKGRWRSVTTVMRYGQHERLALAYQSFSDIQIAKFEKCEDLLEVVILGRAAPVVAPLL